MNLKTIKAIKQLKELEKLGKKPGEIRLAAEDWSSDFQILISTILSARTRDEVTIPIAEKLFQKYGDTKKLARANIKDIKKIIKPINFYKTKSSKIIKCARYIVSNFNSKIPRNMDELLKIPGVGRKTANVFLVAVGKNGLGVDTHVFYISRKLGWAKSEDHHKVEEELKKLFPKRYWRRINEILVRFGKTYTSRKQKDKILEKIRKMR